VLIEFTFVKQKKHGGKNKTNKKNRGKALSMTVAAIHHRRSQETANRTAT
jgi:Na+-transporting methylmalonyl-CoA/oxaloacetate decarboxylase gamma subunit